MGKSANPAADRAGGLQNQRLEAGFPQFLRRAKTGHAGPDDDNRKFHSNRIFSHTRADPASVESRDGPHRVRTHGNSPLWDFTPTRIPDSLAAMSSSSIDWEQLDMIADGFTPDFVEIYREYLAEIPVRFIELRNKIRANDPNQVARAAHQLKGSSANFGFIGVSQPTAKLEQEAKSGSLTNASLYLSEAENGFALAVSEVRARQSI